MIYTLSFSDLMQLSKIRLTTSVVFSSIIGYFIAGGGFDIQLIYLLIGGFLVVAASNGFNQVLEKDLDKMMNRTSQRPLPQDRMSIKQALTISILMVSVGVWFLFMINFWSGLFGFSSVILYVLAYTPLKRISSFSVFVGAFPGAIPFMLGWVAYTNSFGIEALFLFSIQFLWQFPHFWSIAWASHDDYKRAGFLMLPGDKDKSTAWKISIYTFFLIPLSILPYFNLCGSIEMSMIGLLFSIIAGLWFLTKSVVLFNSKHDGDAKKMMFASFIYLPTLQLIYLFDNLL